MSATRLTRRTALRQLGAGAAAVALLATGALPAAAAKPAPLGGWNGPFVDIWALDRERWQTVLLLGSAIARVMSDEEASGVQDDPMHALSVLEQATFPGRLRSLTGQSMDWADLPKARRDAGLLVAAGMTHRIPVTWFEHLHVSLAKDRARTYASGVL